MCVTTADATAAEQPPIRRSRSGRRGIIKPARWSRTAAFHGGVLVSTGSWVVRMRVEPRAR